MLENFWENIQEMPY